MPNDRNSVRTATVGDILRELLRRTADIDARIRDLAEHVDEIDRTLRPYGDGTRIRRQPR